MRETHSAPDSNDANADFITVCFLCHGHIPFNYFSIWVLAQGSSYVRRSTRPLRSPVNSPSFRTAFPLTITWCIPIAVWFGSKVVP